MNKLQKALDKIEHIVTHENCPDGVASAMLLRLVYPQAEVTFCQYNTKQHRELPANPHMLFCDFSPPAERANEFVDAGAVVLDHHATQANVVGLFGELGVYDEVWCGAEMAYHIVVAPSLAPRIVRPPAGLRRFAMLAGIRDTWQKSSPHWREACEQASALLFWPVGDLLNPPWDWAEKEEVGPVLFQKQLEEAQKAIDNSVRMTSVGGTRVVDNRVTSMRGTKVRIFEGVTQTSDAAEILGEQCDLVVGFKYVVDDNRLKLVYSTRSHTGYDCSALAKFHGGGGHKAAAGFTLDGRTSGPNPFVLFLDALGAYENTLRTWPTPDTTRVGE